MLVSLTSSAAPQQEDSESQQSPFGFWQENGAQAAQEEISIPVVQTDRGGQVTFHGPGQVVAYPLLDIRRAGYFVKEYVYRLEESVLRTLIHFGVHLVDPAAHSEALAGLRQDLLYRIGSLVPLALYVWALLSARRSFVGVGRGEYFARPTVLGLDADALAQWAAAALVRAGAARIEGEMLLDL